MIDDRIPGRGDRVSSECAYVSAPLHPTPLFTYVLVFEENVLSMTTYLQNFNCLVGLID